MRRPHVPLVHPSLQAQRIPQHRLGGRLSCRGRFYPARNTGHRTKCRHTDDMLERNQNVTAEVHCPRVPATQPRCHLTRAMAGRFVMGTLQGLPSEICMAYDYSGDMWFSAGMGLASLRLCPSTFLEISLSSPCLTVLRARLCSPRENLSHG